MSYVNIHGKVIEFKSIDKAKKTKKKSVITPVHRGYRVVGVDPAALAEARRVHEKAFSEPFDDIAWLRNAKLTVIKAKIATPDGADQVRLLAERSGWRKVIVEIDVRGK